MTHADRGLCGTLQYPGAAGLPDLLAQLAQLPTWTGRGGFPPEPLWEAVSLATFNFGDVPDAAYAFLPALLDLVTREGRSARDTLLAIGYVVDATLGALPGACDVARNLGPGFLSCLETSQRVAKGQSLEGLAEGR